MRFSVLATAGAARRARLELAHGCRRDAGVHAGRHLRHRQGDGAGRARRRRRADRPRQHLSPVAAPGTRGHRARTAGCIASWDGSRPLLTDSGGFQVFSLGRAAQGPRGRRRVRLADQRRSPVPVARAVDVDPAHARLRHRHGVRRMHAVPGRRATRRRGRWSFRCAGRGARGPRTATIRTRCSASSRAACTTTCATPRSTA